MTSQQHTIFNCGNLDLMYAVLMWPAPNVFRSWFEHLLNRKRLGKPNLLGAGRFCSTVLMTENGEVVVRKRRNSQEVQRLLTEFESSGLGQSESCRNQGRRPAICMWDVEHRAAIR
jgi:hypothetical protein